MTLQTSPQEQQRILWSCDYLPTPRGRLFRAYAPPREGVVTGLFIVNPLGEEAKSSFTVLNDLCRALCQMGWGVGRFDYLGSGDSEGDFPETNPTDWVRDARLALSDFKSVMQVRRVVLLGLRLGGNIAAMLAAEPAAQVSPAALVLWEPVLDLSRYLRHLGWVNRDPQPDGSIDHYGWQLTRSTLHAVKFQMGMNGIAFHCPVYMARISAHGRITPEFSAMASRLPEGSKLVSVAARPFWELIGQATCDPLILKTTLWLRGICPEDAER